MNDSSQRFKDACENLLKNAHKFTQQEEISDSSEEEETSASEVLEKACLSYRAPGGDDVDLRKVKEFLNDLLTVGAVTCLICLDPVKRVNPIWSCQSCYGIFHLLCIRKWAKDTLHHLLNESSDSAEEDRKGLLRWCCPKCRAQYGPENKPSQYLCFCGQVENPSPDDWIVPHSCGRCCNKALNCQHTCSLLCHPGPCPPCPKTVYVSCCCSKSKKISKRCSDKEWLCGKACGKLLPCQKHQCEALCHKGACPPCEVEDWVNCLCKRLKKYKPCHSSTFQCTEVCSRPLPCGKHHCAVVCHVGPCPDCPSAGARSCPCGKKVEAIPCTEGVVPCGDSCDRLLECELHRCSQRCHHGQCGKCLQMRIMKCRCGQREKSVPCCKEFTCETKCKQRRDCGRHNCNRKCCPGNCPPCETQCGKTLNCGKHKCFSLCHPGPCYPCRNVDESRCNCGSAKMLVPCGRKQTVKPPKCSSRCALKPDCHHKERHKHKCHFGACPPCRLLCEKPMSCGHQCQSKCHSAVLTKVETKEKPEGQWDLMNAFKMVLVCEPCPPCTIPVSVTCLGRHETQTVPCHQSKSTSCGRMCGRMLACGNHTCAIECHQVELSIILDLEHTSSNCGTCEEPCQRVRPEGCTHSCPEPCHPGKCQACRHILKLKCHCQMQTMYVSCDDWTSADETKRSDLLTCANRCPKEISCGHRCVLKCHLGLCSTQVSCKKKVNLRCPCKRQKKEVPCFTLKDKDISLACDAECSVFQESAKAAEMEKRNKRDEEAKKIQEKEYQDFLRKTEGKKKRKKKVVEDVHVRSYKNVVVYAFSAIGVLLVAIVAAHYLNLF